jgi:hypothetical protein
VQFFGANDATTADYVEKMSEIKVELSKSKAATSSESSGGNSGANWNERGGGGSSGSSYTKSSSSTETTSERIAPKWRRQQVRGMGNDEQICFMPTEENALLLRRLPYWALYEGESGSFDPYHMPAEEKREWENWIASGKSWFSKQQPAAPLKMKTAGVEMPKKCLVKFLDVYEDLLIEARRRARMAREEKRLRTGEIGTSDF